MKYVNQINILLAGIGVAVVIYTFAVTFFASQPTEFIWVEPETGPESAERRFSGGETPAAFRGSTTTQTSPVETLPVERGRARSGFQTSQPGGSLGARGGFSRPLSESPSRPLEPEQQVRQSNRIEVGRGGGVMPMTQSEQFGRPSVPASESSRIGEMNGPRETQQAQPAEGVKRDSTSDPQPPPISLAIISFRTTPSWSMTN